MKGWILRSMWGGFVGGLSLFAMSLGPAWVFDPNSNEVILWEHADYKGVSIRYSVGTEVSNLTNEKTGGMNWNDKVSSLKVGANVRLITWEHKDYKGKCVGFLGSNAGGHTDGKYPRLSDWNFNDKMSSLKVYDKDNSDAGCP